jgi:cytochrome c oxidase subunit 2
MRKIGTLAILLIGFCISTVYADQPQPWQMGFQTAVTPVMEGVNNLHNLMLVVISGIALFVLGLLGYAVWRFHEKKNPNPSSVSHHTFLEIIWTVIPVVILIVIAVPSFKLLYFMDVQQKPELTIKAIGHQWYWSYEYPEYDINFESRMIPDDELKLGQLRLLDVDNQVVIPVGTTVRILTTSEDVLHSWTIPAFGVKKDSVPGRLNEMWVRVTSLGTYYGQCSEICGMQHGFMPIAVRVVSKELFQDWVKHAKQKYAHYKHLGPTFEQDNYAIG